MDDVADDDVGKADSAPDIETPEEVTPAGELVRMICDGGQRLRGLGVRQVQQSRIPHKEQRHSRSNSLNAAYFRFESGLRTEYRYRPLSIDPRKH